MGGGKSKEVSSSTSEPWKAAQPYLTSNLSAAANVAPTQVYGGQRVADQSSQTQGGLAALTGTANQNMGGQGLSGQYQNVIDAGGYNAQQMNAVNNTQNLANQQWSISPELQRILDQSNENALGSVSLANSASGRYGSGMGNAAVADAIGQNTNNLIYSDLNNFRSRQDAANSNLFSMGQQGFGNLGTAYTGMQAPGQTLLGVGQQQDAYKQSLLNAEIDRFDEQQNAKRNDIAWKQGIFSGAGALGGSTTNKAPGQSGLATGLGYGLTGLGLLSGGGFF
jgi:hypothetical protein